MSDAHVRVERDGPLLIVTLNRPKRMNAITNSTFCMMADAWQEARHDDSVRCVILTGAGGNFCSGADLRAMAGDADDAGAIDSAARIREDPDVMWKGLLVQDRIHKPIVAAVEGVCIAGGCEILQGTDIRVAGESARFGISEARWSLYPAGGSVVRLRRQIPYTEAADILLTGRHIDAREAKRLGLVGHVVPDGQALARAREIAGTICENGPLAIEAILRTLRETETLSEADAFAHERSYGLAVFQSEDAREGPRAFAEKRKPVFRRR